MKPELFVLTIATASPVHMLKSEGVHASKGVVHTSHRLAAVGAVSVKLFGNVNVPPMGRSLQALAKLKALAMGWDGSDAPAPSRLAIENAQLVAEDLEARGVENVRIAADVDGGVAVTVPRRARGQYAAVACDNEGDAYLILEAPPDRPRVSRISIDEAASAMIAFARA